MLTSAKEMMVERITSLFNRPSEAWQRIVDRRERNVMLALHGISRLAGPNKPHNDRANIEAGRIGAVISDDTRMNDHMPIVQIAFNQQTGECVGDLSEKKLAKIGKEPEIMALQEKFGKMSIAQAITLLMREHIEDGVNLTVMRHFDMYNDSWQVIDEYGQRSKARNHRHPRN